MSLLTLDIEKPAAGGRMIARLEGRVVLVSGAIPGERVSARIERQERGVAFAEAVEVISASPDRRQVSGDVRCGGNVFAHIDYSRQLQLKGEIIQDAFGRIGRLPLAERPSVIGSPERGYRMRARLHVSDGRIGFYLEGTHRVCDASVTGQLLPDTSAWLATVQAQLTSAQLRGLSGIEVAENIPGDQRACHLDLHAGADPASYAMISDGLVGVSAERADRPGVVRLAGTPIVTDSIRVDDEPASMVSIGRDARAFFQGNRYLIEPLVRHVVGLVPRATVFDLYAGVGLFGLSLAAAGAERVIAVEGETVTGADLVRNAAPFGSRVTALRRSVESYLGSLVRNDVADATLIVDPPRTGISKDAIAHIIRLQPSRLVYISCDVATLARDTKSLHDAGYSLIQINGIDLFPNTAHVETIAVLTR